MSNAKGTHTYAIIKAGSKQYRVAKGDVIDVDLVSAEEGSEVSFGDVIFLNDGKNMKVGSPSVEKAVVKGKVLGVVSGPKITSVKYKRSHHQYRKFGHRQKYSRVEITSIS